MFLPFLAPPNLRLQRLQVLLRLCQCGVLQFGLHLCQLRLFGSDRGFQRLQFPLQCFSGSLYLRQTLLLFLQGTSRLPFPIQLRL